MISPTYISHPCGAETNPKESGYYLTNEGNLRFNKNYERWYKALDSAEYVIAEPTHWLEPIAQSVDQIQEEAFEAGYNRGRV
jgi:hypothetical protein